MQRAVVNGRWGGLERLTLFGTPCELDALGGVGGCSDAGIFVLPQRRDWTESASRTVVVILRRSFCAPARHAHSGGRFSRGNAPAARGVAPSEHQHDKSALHVTARRARAAPAARLSAIRFACVAMAINPTDAPRGAAAGADALRPRVAECHLSNEDILARAAQSSSAKRFVHELHHL